MSEPDVVALLDAWIATEDDPPAPATVPFIQRARDEIVALRQHYPIVVEHYIKQARAEALEEAARVVEDRGFGTIHASEAEGCAAAIRGLKDEPG